MTILETITGLVPMQGLIPLDGLIPLAPVEPAPVAPPGFGDKAATVMGVAKYVAYVIAVLALIGAAVTLFFGNSHNNEGLKKIGYIIAGVFIISTAVSLVAFFGGW